MCAYFRTGSFATGVALVDEIGRLADAANHHPDVDLRYPGVTVRLVTHEVDGLSDRDVALARQISAAARDLGVEADRRCRCSSRSTTTATRRAPVLARRLGTRKAGDEDVVDPHGRSPSIWFQGMDEPGPQRNRMHMDVYVPPDRPRRGRRGARPAGRWWTKQPRRGGAGRRRGQRGARHLAGPRLNAAAPSPADDALTGRARW